MIVPKRTLVRGWHQRGRLGLCRETGNTFYHRILDENPKSAERRQMMLSIILAIQGAFYVLTGLWPFFHPSSFVSVVGPKPDVFQLHVTAGLIVGIGAALLYGSARPDQNLAALGTLTALVFVVMDVAYAPFLRDIYWLDAVFEAGLATMIIWALRADHRNGPGSRDTHPSQTPRPRAE